MAGSGGGESFEDKEVQYPQGYPLGMGILPRLYTGACLLCNRDRADSTIKDE